MSWCLKYKIMAPASNCSLETICRKHKKENVVLSSDSKAHLKKCLNVMRWMDVKPLSKMSAGHKLDGHKNCQKCLQVMRWLDTNTVKVSAGHEMDEDKLSKVCRS